MNNIKPLRLILKKKKLDPNDWEAVYQRGFMYIDGYLESC